MTRHAIGFAAAMTCVLVPAGTAAALATASSEGLWPDSWPEELEQYRDRSVTLEMATGTSEDFYGIPFDSREDFEAAWPHILAVKSEGAPITLRSGPFGYVLDEFKAGVWILAPPVAMKATSDLDRTLVSPGPPWFPSAYLPNGQLPEYVSMFLGQWVPASNDRLGSVRARVEIVIVCDGKIVDLNRIPFPPDTPIIDERFQMVPAEKETEE